MFQNKACKGIFLHKKQNQQGDREKWHHEELHNFYVTLNTIKVMKSTRIAWAGHVIWMTGMINILQICCEAMFSELMNA
jgi:hypothetical protein